MLFNKRIGSTGPRNNRQSTTKLNRAARYVTLGDLILAAVDVTGSTSGAATLLRSKPLTASHGRRIVIQ